MWSRSLAIARHDLRILRSDPSFMVGMVAMPLIVMAFLRPAFQGALLVDGVEGATGAEHVVPGVATTFALFLVSNVGFGIFREHGWNTWERLRAGPATGAQVLAGKSITPMLELGLQQAVLLGVGGLLFGLQVRGSAPALILVATAYAAALIGLGYVLLALCRTVMQLTAITNLGTMLLAGLGGALTPLSTLPDWAAAIAPAVPTYWAMRGYNAVIIDGGGLGEVLEPVIVLLGFAAAFALVAWRRYEVGESKVFFA
jgi:ABC-2 type transport system permease protein